MSNDKKQEKTVEPAQDLDSKMADAVAKAVGKAIEEALPVAVMAASKVNHVQQATGFKGGAAPSNFGPRCSTCGQYEKACKGEHVMMIVAPRNPRRFKAFPGMFVNSIQYISPNPHTPIPVPAENDFSHRIKVWEDAEEDLYVSRSISHDSGVLSGRPGGTNNTVPYAGAGFRG